MSGPKVSVYQLSAEEKKRYYEQRKIIKQTEMNLQQILKRMTCLRNEINTLKGTIERGEDLAKGTRYDCDFENINEQIEAALNKLQEFEKEYQRINESYRVDKAGTVKLSVDMDKERVSKLKALEILNASIGEQIKLVKSLQKEALKEIEAIDASLKEELQEQILGGFSISFSNIKREIQAKKTDALQTTSLEELETRKQEELAKLRTYQDKIFAALIEVSDTVGSPDRLSPVLADKLKAIKAKAAEITSVDFIENYYAISVIPFVKECWEYIELLSRFDEAYMRYEFLCNEAGLVAAKYAVTEENIVVILSETEKLEQEDAEAQTKAFIANAIDEAMQEMGYDLVGHREVTKKSGRKAKHELYHFGEGTGVDITFSDEGQITMELGGFDNVDRNPDEAEADRLCDDMQRFCGEYAALERVLEKKGVLRQNIKMFPPVKDYAQIFNTTDYDMTKPVQKFEAKKGQKTETHVRHAE